MSDVFDEPVAWSAASVNVNATTNVWIVCLAIALYDGMANISFGSKEKLHQTSDKGYLTIQVQWFTSFFDRQVKPPNLVFGPPSTDFDDFSCLLGNAKHDTIWGFYLCSSVWDITTLVVSLRCLLHKQTRSPLMSKLSRTMLVDGLIYFVAITVVNVVNIFIFLNSSSPVKKGSVAVAYTAAWIFSQRILISLSGALHIPFALDRGIDHVLWLDSVMRRRAAVRVPTRTVTVTGGTTSVEGTSREVITRLRSTQRQTESVSRSDYQAVRGTVQSSSGGFLDSCITIEITPQDSPESSRGDVPSHGPAHPDGNEDPPDRTPDYEMARISYKPSEGPFMTTRRF
ncbi:hypothetical protein BDM02DRAFT_3182843 [Thelephora ganbajun]|uniref:Uncharacterized protein n=1 Tax=Thelephora ganbajun TaxID=370292 RepID=A0ACB6ZTW5_THEGA|nr:hypothetical protein BDM02DRAFT_3182843 [Thelephora ganbajun]